MGQQMTQPLSNLQTNVIIGGQEQFANGNLDLTPLDGS
jgi:hypothetical protein